MYNYTFSGYIIKCNFKSPLKSYDFTKDNKWLHMILFQIIRKPQYPNGEMQTNGSLASGFLRNRCCVALTMPFCGMVTVTTGQFIWRIQVCIISLIDAGQFKFFCTTTCSDESNCLQLNTSTDFMNIYDIQSLISEYRPTS